MELNLKIITLNCWGIPVFSKDRKPRMLAIAKHLAAKQYDIICLQEVWSNSDYELISNYVKDVLPYSHYFHSGVIGSGICILTKYQIREVFFYQWPVNGYIHKLQHGDWFGGKGVGLCILKVNNYLVNIYSAHLHAEYDRNCDEYMAHRVLQAIATAQFIRLTGAASDLIVLAGDLNTEPGDLAYRILRCGTSFQDAFLPFADQMKRNFATNETYTNTYSLPKYILEKYEGKRIDYILYRVKNNLNVTVKEYNHPLPSRVPGENYSYSDHEAVYCNLVVTRASPSNTSDMSKNGTQNILLTIPSCTMTSSSSVPTEQQDNFNYETVLLESQTVLDSALNRLTYHRRVYWFLTALLFSMLFVTMEMEAPFNYIKIYQVLRIVITAFVCFTLIMASLWNNIEYHAVLAGKLSIQTHLEQLNDYEKDKMS